MHLQPEGSQSLVKLYSEMCEQQIGLQRSHTLQDVDYRMSNTGAQHLQHSSTLHYLQHRSSEMETAARHVQSTNPELVSVPRHGSLQHLITVIAYTNDHCSGDQ
jgi:hypothetical protein